MYPVVEHTRTNCAARNHSRLRAPHHRTQSNTKAAPGGMLRERAVFVAASHQTRLDTRSMLRERAWVFQFWFSIKFSPQPPVMTLANLHIFVSGIKKPANNRLLENRLKMNNNVLSFIFNRFFKIS